jgi:hypothetical protein
MPQKRATSLENKKVRSSAGPYIDRSRDKDRRAGGRLRRTSPALRFYGPSPPWDSFHAPTKKASAKVGIRPKHVSTLHGVSALSI